MCLGKQRRTLLRDLPMGVEWMSPLVLGDSVTLIGKKRHDCL